LGCGLFHPEPIKSPVAIQRTAPGVNLTHGNEFNSFALCAPPGRGAAYFALAYVSENQVSSHVESAGKRQTISPDFPKLAEGSQKDSGRLA
jgi:hypothetical protein